VSRLNQTVSADSKKLCQFTIRSPNRPSLQLNTTAYVLPQLAGNLSYCPISQHLVRTSTSGSKVLRERTNISSDRGRYTAIHFPKLNLTEHLWLSFRAKDNLQMDPNRTRACSKEKSDFRIFYANFPRVWHIPGQSAHQILVTSEESGRVLCELREKCKKVDKLNANKTQKLNWLFSNKRKDAKTQRNVGFKSQNRCNDFN